MDKRSLNLDLEVAKRLTELRNLTSFSRVRFSKMVGCDSVTFANYEYGRVRLPYAIATRVLKLLNVSAVWLAEGGGAPDSGYEYIELDFPVETIGRKPFLDVYSQWKEKRSKQKENAVQIDERLFAKQEYTERVLHAFFTELVRQTPPAHRMLLVKSVNAAALKFQRDIRMPGQLEIFGSWTLDDDEVEEKSLRLFTLNSKPQNVPAFKTVDELIAAVREKCASPGAKAELARELNVAPARVSEWLSGKTEPGGKYALLMQDWVNRKRS